MTTQELYLKTIFCCMACDGDIATEEVAMVREMTTNTDLFGDLDVETTINAYVDGINSTGVKFLNRYLKDLTEFSANEEEQLNIVNLAVNTIKADDRIEYSEVKFFKKIRSRLSLSDESILTQHPDIEDWLLPDINVTEELEWDNVVFANISLKEDILN